MFMRRGLILLIWLLSLLSSSYAQKVTEGSLAPLKNCGKAKVILDFSDASIHGMTVDDFANYEKDWEIDKPIIISKFIIGLGEKCPSIRFGTELNGEITLLVKVISINTKGNYVCKAFIMNSQQEKIACITELNARGGTFGSKLNLIKDGAEHTGVALGKFINRMIRD